MIDLLGREQIADAPTAVGELMKNALDAGARNASINFEKEKRTLTICDDGLGMRSNDVIEKWLVIATDSKQGNKNADDSWAKYADEEQRLWVNGGRSFGEKGIGRLSVGALGRSTLLWSVWGEGKEKQGTLCFVHWHLFRHPKLLFEQIPVPLSVHKAEATGADVNALFNRFADELRKSTIFKDNSWNKNLRDEIQLDIVKTLSSRVKGMRLGWNVGTTFKIFEVSSNVDDLFIQAGQLKLDEDPTPDLLKAYSTFPAFWNPFQEKQERKFSITTLIDGHPTDCAMRDFWKRNDFDDADHHINIEVNEEGFAEGSLRNYRKREDIKYQRQLTKLPRLHSSPGPFKIEIGYVKGLPSDSMLNADDHLQFSKRLEIAGGFYVYVDNVRIQPYGNSEADFIGFEERRNKNSGRYYFSHRRMFGGLFINSSNCVELKEKAGREGFQVNGAYRGLRYWLREIFLDLADSYYGGKSTEGKNQKERKRKRNRKTKERLDELRDLYLESIGLARRSLSDLERDIKSNVITARRLIRDEQNGIPGLGLRECKIGIDLLRDRLDEIGKLPGEPNQAFIIEGDDLEGLETYITKKHEAQSHLTKEISILSSLYQKLVLRADAKEERLKEIIDRIHEADNMVERRLRESMEPLKARMETLSHELDAFCISEIERLKEIRESILKGITPQNIADDKTGELSKLLETALQKQRIELRDVSLVQIERMEDDLKNLAGQTSSAFIAQDYAAEITNLNSKVELLAEVAQLGLVLESATHEYEGQLSSIRHCIGLLSDSLDEKQQHILDSIEHSFEIIDERLRLFDPLLRRKTASIQTVTGVEIRDFITRRFADHVKNTEMVEFTNNFISTEWNHIKRPVFLGAIHNLIANAIYWIRSVEAPKVRLSVSRGQLIISDNGPGVANRDEQRIFDPGFSRKPHGRGLGLYVAKESLKALGYSLALLSSPAVGGLPGANFGIVKVNDEERK